MIQTLLDQAQKEIRAQEIKIQALTLELAHLRRIRFGRSNESLTLFQSQSQLDLFEETVQADTAAVAAEIEQLGSSAKQSVNKPPRTRAGRQALPDHLPRIEHYHEPISCHCRQCGRDLVKIGENITEQLDVEPVRFFVHRHIRAQYACKICETITAEPVPPAVIDGGMAAPGLLAWVMPSKYLNHLPLYCFEQIAAREEVMLSRSTLAEWVGRVGAALQPLVDRLTWHLLQGNTLHADETRWLNLTPAMARLVRLIYGPIAAMIWKRGHASSSSIIKPAAVGSMHKTSCKAGRVICWLMITGAINPYSHQHH
jgi:transposase